MSEFFARSRRLSEESNSSSDDESEGFENILTPQMQSVESSLAGSQVDSDSDQDQDEEEDGGRSGAVTPIQISQEELEKQRKTIESYEEVIRETRTKIAELENRVFDLDFEVLSYKEEVRENKDKICKMKKEKLETKTYFEDAIKLLEDKNDVKFVAFDGEKMEKLEVENQKKSEEILELKEELKKERLRNLKIVRKESNLDISELKIDCRISTLEGKIRKKNEKIDDLEFEIFWLKRKIGKPHELVSENLKLKTELHNAKLTIRKDERLLGTRPPKLTKKLDCKPDEKSSKKGNFTGLLTEMKYNRLAEELDFSNSQIVTVLESSAVLRAEEVSAKDEEIRMMRQHIQDLEKTIQYFKNLVEF